MKYLKEHSFNLLDRTIANTYKNGYGTREGGLPKKKKRKRRPYKPKQKLKDQIKEFRSKPSFNNDEKGSSSSKNEESTQQTEGGATERKRTRKRIIHLRYFGYL